MTDKKTAYVVRAYGNQGDYILGVSESKAEADSFMAEQKALDVNFVYDGFLVSEVTVIQKKVYLVERWLDDEENVVLGAYEKEADADKFKAEQMAMDVKQKYDGFSVTGYDLN